MVETSGEPAEFKLAGYIDNEQQRFVQPLSCDVPGVHGVFDIGE